MLVVVGEKFFFCLANGSGGNWSVQIIILFTTLVCT